MAVQWYTAAYWHERADESRAIADGLKDPISKATMLKIAAGYERNAAREELRRAPETPAGKRDS